MFGIIQEVIFPLLCHSEVDEDLWQTDPLEYVRVTYGKCFVYSFVLRGIEGVI